MMLENRRHLWSSPAIEMQPVSFRAQKESRRCIWRRDPRSLLVTEDEIQRPRRASRRRLTLRRWRHGEVGPCCLAVARCASPNLAPARRVPRRFVPSRSASRKSASAMFACEALALRKLAPARFAWARSASVRSAPSRFASLSVASLKVAAWRSTPARLAVARLTCERFFLARFSGFGMMLLQ